jgi:hypothetical protein
MAILDSKGQVIDSMNGYFAPELMQALLQEPRRQSGRRLAGVNAGGRQPHQEMADPDLAPPEPPDGSFAGVIVVMMDPTYFVEDYDRLDVPPAAR